MSSRQFVSPQVFAQLAGISESTLWRRIRDQSIPSWQPGGRRTRVLIPLSALGAVQSAAVESSADDAPRDAAPRKPIPGPPRKWRTRTPDIEET